MILLFLLSFIASASTFSIFSQPRILISHSPISPSIRFNDELGITTDTLRSRLTSDRSNPISPELIKEQIDFENIDNNFHKRDDDWGCMKTCGACCMLGPLDWRPQLKTVLSQPQYDLYVSMIGKDNWCIYFDKEQRQCTQFDTRPDFCRVEKQKYIDMYKLEEDEYTDFLRFCCTESIQDAYGEVSVEDYRYSRLMDLISHDPDESDPNEDCDEEQDEELSYKEIILNPRHREDDFEGEDEEVAEEVPPPTTTTAEKKKKNG